MLTPLTSELYGAGEAQRLDTLLRDAQVDAVWVRDLPAVPAGDADAGQGDDPFAYLAHLLGRGARPALLGTASVILGSRHPLIIARAAVGAQHASGGRFVLGLGSGGKPAMSAAMGLTDRPKRLLRDDWSSIRSALRGNAGDGMRFVLPPEHVPPPMYLASADPSSWDAIEGEADGWLAFAAADDELRSQHRQIQSLCEGDIKVAIRLDVRLIAGREQSSPSFTRGRATLTRGQLVGLLARWRELPVDHVMVGVGGTDQRRDLGTVLECWHGLT